MALPVEAEAELTRPPCPPNARRSTSRSGRSRRSSPARTRRCSASSIRSPPPSSRWIERGSTTCSPTRRSTRSSSTTSSISCSTRRPAVIESGRLNRAGIRGGRAGGGRRWRVAIIDTGVSRRHNALTGKIVSEACYFVRGRVPERADLAARRRRRRRVHVLRLVRSRDPRRRHRRRPAPTAGGHRGVAPVARIVMIRVGHRTAGGGWGTRSSDLDRGLQRVLDLRRAGQPIAAVSLSVGFGAFTSVPACRAARPSTEQLAAQLQAAGVAVVAAAGNEGSFDAVAFPACLPSVYAVSATDDHDAPALFTNVATMTDWFAPGVGVVAPWRGRPERRALDERHVDVGAPRRRRLRPPARCVGNTTPADVAADLRATGRRVTEAGHHPPAHRRPRRGDAERPEQRLRPPAPDPADRPGEHPVVEHLRRPRAGRARVRPRTACGSSGGRRGRAGRRSPPTPAAAIRRRSTPGSRSSPAGGWMPCITSLDNDNGGIGQPEQGGVPRPRRAGVPDPGARRGGPERLVQPPRPPGPLIPLPVGYAAGSSNATRPPGGRLDPDPAAVGLDQSPGDRQAEPGAAGGAVAAGIGAGEPGERLVAEPGGKPGPSSTTRTDGRPSAATATRTTEPAGAWRMALSIRLRTTRPSAVGLPRTCTRVDASRASVTPRRRGDRRERLDGLVGDLGQVDRHRVQVEAAALDAGEQEEVVDQRRQRLDVAAHRAQVAVGVGRDAVGERVDGDPQRGQRRAQVVTDARQHRVALGLVPGPLPLERVEAGGELVERAGRRGRARRCGRCRCAPRGRRSSIRRTVDSSWRTSRPSGAEATTTSRVANTAVTPSTAATLASSAESRIISRASSDGGEGADRQRGERDGEHLVAQRPRRAG